MEGEEKKEGVAEQTAPETVEEALEGSDTKPEEVIEAPAEPTE